MAEPQPPEETTLSANSQVKEKGEWWRLFVPSKNLFFTPLLIDINIVLFILMVISSGDSKTIISPNSILLIQWGANYKPLTLDGEWWRLFTSVFEHIGIIHLVMNMYALLFVGVLLEPILGKVQYIAAYLVTGIMGNILSVWWHHDNSVGAGASGAIFGMYGVFLALLTTNFVDKAKRKPLLTSIGIFVIYNLAYGMKSGIDNAAHVGGLLSGLVIGYIYFIASRSKQPQNKLRGAAVVLIAGIITTLVIVPRIQDPETEFRMVMQEISQDDHMALHLPTTTDEQLISYLKDTTLPAFDRAEKEAEKLRGMKLSKRSAKERDLVGAYLKYRQNIAKLLLSKVEEKTDRYDNEINDLEKRIAALVLEINSLSN